VLVLYVVHEPIRGVLVHLQEKSDLRLENSYRFTIDTAYEANVAHVIIHFSSFVSKTRESVDNDTEYDIEEQQDDDNEEGKIIYRANEKDRL
jgi:hypothetical protein